MGKQLKNRVLNARALALSTIILISSSGMAKEGIELPPDPGVEADKTLEGVDANKNGVRDDVELFIYHKLGKKDPKVYRAYFLYAQNDALMIKNRLNKATLKKYVNRMVTDSYCIRAVDPEKSTERDIREFRLKIRNTKERLEAINQVGRTMNKISNVQSEQHTKDKWRDLCRF